MEKINAVWASANAFAGRPPIAGREEQQRFWAAIAEGLSTEDAAATIGASESVGRRLFRLSGGMRIISLEPKSTRDLAFAEREEIGLMKAQGAGVREIARRLDRSLRLFPESFGVMLRLVTELSNIARVLLCGTATAVPSAQR